MAAKAMSMGAVGKVMPMGAAWEATLAGAVGADTANTEHRPTWGSRELQTRKRRRATCRRFG